MGRTIMKTFPAHMSALRKIIKKQIAGIIWRKQHMEEVIKVEERYMDYEILEDIKFLRNKELIIYGAGDYGRQAAEMLQQLDFHKFNFCDRDSSKHGMNICGGSVYSIVEIEKKENLLVIIAVANENSKKEIEQSLTCIKQIKFLSFFALKTAWKYYASDYTKIETNMGAIAHWYQTLGRNINIIKSAYESPILVYQHGKVGSSSVSEGLRRAGVQNTHIHQFLFKNDIAGKLLLGDDEENFKKKYSIFHFQIPEYVRWIKKGIKGKKIITMVRDPIAVDLSAVFQWIGTGVCDRYFSEQLREGNSFLQAVLNHMLKFQNRLFDWFDDELKELCGIDVFDYPFDCDKGYSIIKDCGVEILLLKTEKLSQMTEVIRNFTDSPQFEMLNENMGKNKEYVHIYEKVKKNLVLPDEYIDFYFKGNPQVNHFYSKAEQEFMKNKWKCKTKG